MKKGYQELPVNPYRIVNLNGQLYGRISSGQMLRIDAGGNMIPRIRMSKKEKLRLRKKLSKEKPCEYVTSIADNASFIPAVNPKSEEQLNAEKQDG
jgi:hypothetical protein